jgi:hypothetical protein
MVAGRCTRDDSVRPMRESSLPSHPELQRYRAGGPLGRSCVHLSRDNANLVDFYES